MLLTTESFKTTLGSTTRLRDIFMHVVLIKNTVGHAARRVLDVTKKKSQDRFAVVLCLFLQQPQPTTIVSKFYYRNPIITRRMLPGFYSMYQACKNLFWILAPGKMDVMQTVFHLNVHLSSLMRSVYAFKRF